MLQLAANIKLIRQISKKTQTEFGKIFGATRAMIISYEKAIASPNDLFVNRLSRYSSVPPADLLDTQLRETDIRIKNVDKVENEEKAFLESRNSSKVDNIEILNKDLSIGKLRLTIGDYLNKIEQHSEFLQTLLSTRIERMDANLVGLLIGQRSIQANIEAGFQYTLDREAGGDQAKATEMQEELDRRIGEKMGLKPEKDNYAGK